jgi:SET domain-containing protein
VADATVRGGRARFINHSCDPNCYTKIFTIDGTRKIGIYAKKAIALGQELAYDYKVRAEFGYS